MISPGSSPPEITASPSERRLSILTSLADTVLPLPSIHTRLLPSLLNNAEEGIEHLPPLSALQSMLTIVFIPGAMSPALPVMANLTVYNWFALAFGLMLRRVRGIVFSWMKSKAAWKSWYFLNCEYSEPGMLISTSGFPDEMKHTTGIPAPMIAGASKYVFWRYPSNGAISFVSASWFLQFSYLAEICSRP